MKLSHLNKLALSSAALVLIGSLLLGFLFYYVLPLSLWTVLLWIILLFSFVYLVFSLKTRKFILTQLRKVYETPLFQNEPYLHNEQQEIDLGLFVNRIQRFAENKLNEIEQLHNRDDFRKDFLGDVSHELKTPLFTAQGYLLTVLDDSIDDPKLKKKYLKRAQKSIERLGAIVKDLDMISKLETGMKLSQKRFNLVQTVQDVFEMLEFRAGKKNISLGFKEPYAFPIMVWADQEKIEQVLINLITNSINYGKPDGNTLVGIRSATPHRIQVDVSDDGIGIDPEHIPRLFERFYRADKSRSREQGGSGLGLAIVKHILEAHEQKITVESEYGKGATFSFTLNKAN